MVASLEDLIGRQYVRKAKRQTNAVTQPSVRPNRQPTAIEDLDDALWYIAKLRSALGDKFREIIDDGR